MIDDDIYCSVKSVSSFYETKPYGKTDQGNFINAVIGIETEYSVLNLFEFLKGIENGLGRQTVERWGPREIDLDILFYNDLIYEDENITIPHEGIILRDFVVIPMSEIAGDFVHPVLGIKVSDIKLPETGSNIIRKYQSQVVIK